MTTVSAHTRLRLGAFTVSAALIAVWWMGVLRIQVSAAPTDPIPATLVQTIHTSIWSPASPDPSGIAWRPGPDTLLVVDSEVDENTGAGYHDVNLWEITRTGTVVDTGTTWQVGGVGGYTAEPTGIGFDPSTGTAFISSDSPNRIHVVTTGGDGAFGTADDSRTVINTSTLGLTDTEDPDFAASAGALFFLDGTSRTVHRIDPGDDGRFGTEDDVASSFSLLPIANTDYEALAYHPARDILVVGSGNDHIYEITLDGQLIRTIDVEPIDIEPDERLSGLAVAPSSTTPGEWTYWVVDRGTDNDGTPTENDGRILELSVPPFAGNTPPSITSVTIDQASPRTDDTLTVTVEADDSDGDPLSYSYQWHKNGVALTETGPTLDLSVPGNGDKGDAISVRVIAHDGSADSAAFTSAAVAVVNSAPSFDQDLGDRTDSEGDTVAFSAGASDPDADGLTYSATGLPRGISIDPDTGQISGTLESGAAAGSPYTVEVSVADGAASSPISLVQSAAIHTNSVTTQTATFPSAPTEGNLLVAFALIGNVDFTLPAGWQLAAHVDATPDTIAFYRVAGSSEPSAVTLQTSAASRISLSIYEYAGMHGVQAEVLDRVATASGTGAETLTIGPTATTRQANEVLIAGISFATGRNATDWTNGFAALENVTRHSTAHRIVSSIGGYQTAASWTGQGTSGASAALLTFRGAQDAPVTDTFTWTVSGPSAPDAPVLIAPADGATGVGMSPSLSVEVSDPDGGDLSVEFYGRALNSGVFELVGSDEVASGQTASAQWTSIGAGQAFEWYATVSDGSLTTTGPTWTFTTAAGSDPVLVGAGDIARCSSIGDEQTAAIVAGVQGVVFTTGDNVYEDGINPEGSVANFEDCYEPSWGAFKDRTRPIPGNRDYGIGATNNLDGYFAYFGANATDAGGKSYYSYDVGDHWHVVNLDSECQLVAGGCGVGSPQYQWLIADLAANADRNVIAVWHRPAFSSGGTNSSGIRPMLEVLYDWGVDIALVGHDHIYDRLAPMDPDGTLDPEHGIRHFVVGTGGASHHDANDPESNSEVANDDTYGVLKLTLRADSYDWEFLPVAGATFTDVGTDAVHGPPNRAPLLTDPGDQAGAVGEAVSLQLSASDPDGDALTYAATGLPDGLGIDPDTGLVSGTLTVAGSFGVSVTVSDGTLEATASFDWEVTAVDDPPAAPTGLSAKLSTVAVTLAWNSTPDPDLAGYRVFRSTSGLPGSFVELTTGSTTATSFTDATAPVQQDLHYQVRAYDVAGNGSAPAEVVTKRQIWLRATSNGENKAKQAHLDIPRPSGVQAGDLLVAVIDARGAAQIAPPAGWSLVLNDASGSALRQAAFYRIASGTEPATYRWTLSAKQGAAGAIAAYGGINVDQPFDVAAGSAAANSSTIAAPSIEASSGGSLLIGAFGLGANGSIGEPTDMLGQPQATMNAGKDKLAVRIADQLVDAGQTGQRAAIASGGGANVGQLLAFRASTAAAPGDSEPPSRPSGVNATAVAPTRISLTWSPSTDNVGVARYDIFRDGSFLASVLAPTTSYTDTTASPETTYSYQVQAYDAAGNASERSDAAQATTPSVDTPPPPAGITFVGSTSGATKTATSVSISRPSGVVAGDLLIVSLDITGTPTVTGGGPWPGAECFSDGAGSQLTKLTCYRFAGASEPSSYTWHLGATAGASGVVVAYRGVHPTAPVVAVGRRVSVAASTSIVAPSVTADVENTMLVGLYGTATNGSISPPTGMTSRGTASAAGKLKVTSLAAEELIAPAASTGNRVAVASKAAANIGHLIALRPAAS